MNKNEYFISIRENNLCASWNVKLLSFNNAIACMQYKLLSIDRDNANRLVLSMCVNMTRQTTVSLTMSHALLILTLLVNTSEKLRKLNTQFMHWYWIMEYNSVFNLMNPPSSTHDLISAVKILNQPLRPECNTAKLAANRLPSRVNTFSSW